MVFDTLRAVTAGMKTMRHRIQAAYTQIRINFLGQRIVETSCPYLSLLINEVSVNELKYKVCIFEIEMFKENNLILKT